MYRGKEAGEALPPGLEICGFSQGRTADANAGDRATKQVHVTLVVFQVCGFSRPPTTMPTIRHTEPDIEGSEEAVDECKERVPPSRARGATRDLTFVT
jgi:hypothetical protein